MAQLRISGYSILAAIFLVTSATAHTPPSSLFSRQGSTCPADFNQCAQSGLPDNFCCPSTANCIVLAANTTVLCCPKDSQCEQIRPIICDINAQDASKFPNNTLKTTALSVSLGTCGSGCCPFGYTCNSGGNCEKDANQNISPLPQTSSGAPSSTPAPTSNPVSSNPATSTSGEPAQDTTAPSCNAFPAPAVLVGFFPGLVLGIVLTVLSVCLLGARRRHKDSQVQKRHSGSSFGNISEPTLQSDLRSDFLRKGQITREPTLKRVKSYFRRSGVTADLSGGVNRISRGGGMGELSEYEQRRSRGYAAPIIPPVPLTLQASKAKQQTRPPVTPPLQREPSYENIDIFTDGDTASALRNGGRNNNNNNNIRIISGNGSVTGSLRPPVLPGSKERGSTTTTFSDMMEKSGLAGLQKGQPFIYKGNSPGYTSPR